MSIIQVNNLVKEYKIKEFSTKGIIKKFLSPSYKIIKAVDDISFSIEKGETVGYIGPNGSGKSTTIKMLTGVLTPTAGNVYVNGRIPYKERIKNNKEIGVVTGNRSSLYWDVPIIESFKVFQQLYEIPPTTFKNNLNEFINLLNLGSLLNMPERQLSLGQRMKCNITAAFLHNPKIVFLDEPTIGLDIESKQQIRKFIRKMQKDRQTTFVITSHDFQDIESLCDRIILITHGKKILDDKIDDVKKKFNDRKSIIFEVEDNSLLPDSEFFANMKINLPNPYCIEIEYCINQNDLVDIIGVVSKFCKIHDISIYDRTIESIIHELIL